LAVFFYNIFLLMFSLGIRISSLWNKKSRLWLEGRKNIFQRLKTEAGNDNAQHVWIHCASLGEFEQGLPVLEKIKSRYPAYKIILTFFSPSGYEIRKNYQKADGVFYLPLDSPVHAKEFLDILHLRLVIFVKYDYWYYYLSECKKRKIPLLVISALFRKEMNFFRWYGKLSRMMLKFFTHLFVQDRESLSLLETIGIKHNVTVSGDTRFDRVAEITEHFQPLEEVKNFCSNYSILVAGSTWPEDEKIIRQATVEMPELKIIIAPHEIHSAHLEQLKLLFPQSVFYSELKTGNGQPATGNSLIIDNIGMLSRLYHYATIAYVGGGFGKGIHNTLEAAVHGKPVIFGPNHKKFREAVDLVESGAGICINNDKELQTCLQKLLNDKEDLYKRSGCAAEYVNRHKGASEKIMHYIAENRLLTS
jgi:3-deoxy-D-manno-octulosonic-acid transferase